MTFAKRDKSQQFFHQKPTTAEVRACRHWLESEIAAVNPHILVLLGATAAQALLGSTFRLTQHRGEWQHFGDIATLATIHPSAILRMQGNDREQAYEELVDDLRLAAMR